MSSHPDTARLKRFYAQYAPEKTDADVKATLDKFGGSPDTLAKMWAGLQKKYGPEPAAESLHPDTARLKRFYAKYAPEKTDADVKATLDKFGGSADNLAKMWAGLTKKYGPEDTAGPSTPVSPSTGTPAGPPGTVYTTADMDRMRRMYAKYAPEKTEADLKATLDKFGVSNEQLEKMWAGLQKKYGPEPPAPPAPAVSVSRPVSTPTPVGGGKVYTPADTARLKRFYNKYAPEKTDEDVKATLDKFGDSQENLAKMWAGLMKKYGPETDTSTPVPVPTQPFFGGRATPANAPVPAADQQTEAFSEEKVKLRLKRLFLKYDPALANPTDLEEMYDRYQHAAGGHRAMFAELRSKYGPEPSLDEYLPDAAPSVDPTGAAPLRSAINSSREATMAGSSRGATEEGSTPYRPARVLPTVKAPAALINETMSNKRRSDAFKRSELESKNRIVCSQMSIRLFGAEYMVYEMASMDAQKRFRTAFEIDISLHVRIAPKFVRVVRVGTIGGIVIDVDIDVPEDEDLVAAATNPNLEPYERTTLQDRRTKEFQLKESSIKILLDELADAILCGRFRLTNTRASFRDDLGGNPVAVYAQSIVLDGVNVADYRREQQAKSSRFPGSALVVSLNSPDAIESQQRAYLLSQFGGDSDNPLYQAQLQQLLATQQQMRAMTASSAIPGGLATSLEASPPRRNELIVEGEAFQRGTVGDVARAGQIVEHSHFGLLAGVPLDGQVDADEHRSRAAPSNKPAAPNFLNQLWFDPNTPGAQQPQPHSGDGNPPSRYDFQNPSYTSPSEGPRGFGDASADGGHRVSHNNNQQQQPHANDRDAHIANLMAVIHQQNASGPGEAVHASHPSGMPVSPQGVVYGFHGSQGEQPPINAQRSFTLGELQQLPPETLAFLLAQKEIQPTGSGIGAKRVLTPPPQGSDATPQLLRTSSAGSVGGGGTLSVGELYNRLHSNADPTRGQLRSTHSGLMQPAAGQVPPIVSQRGPSVNEGVQTSKLPTPQISPRVAEEAQRQREAQQQQAEFYQSQSAQQTQILQMIADMQRQQMEMQQAHQRERDQAQQELLKQQQRQEAHLQAQILQQQQQFQQYQQQMSQYQQYQQQVAASNQLQSSMAINAATTKADSLQGQLENQQVQHRLLHQQYQTAYTDQYSFNNQGLPASDDTRRHTIPDASIDSPNNHNAMNYSAQRNASPSVNSSASAQGFGVQGKRGSVSLVPPSIQGFQFN